MSLHTPRQQTRLDYLLRIMLTVVLVFAAWHVASHDIDISNDLNVDEQCQVCILNHVPISDLPTLAWIIPILLLSLVHLVPKLEGFISSYRNTHGARAPPLF